MTNIQDLLEKHNLRHGIELDAKVLDEFVKELEALIAREVAEARIDTANHIQNTMVSPAGGYCDEIDPAEYKRDWVNKQKAIVLVVVLNIVFWGGFAICVKLAETIDIFRIICAFYLEIWILIGVSTFGLYKLLRGLL